MQAADHLAQVVRRDVGGHADGDAGGAVEQHVRQARRQAHRLLQRAVEIRLPVHGALAQLRQQGRGIRRQPRLGVAHGGEGLGIVRRAPVALPVDHRVAVAERLRHQHHGLVAGRVAVRMELADHVAHGARRLLGLRPGRQAELAHGVDDAPLHRLEAVADVRQRAIEDDVHRIIEVGLLGELLQRQLLDALEISCQLSIVLHGRLTSARLPLASSHARRSAARFFASSMSISWSGVDRRRPASAAPAGASPAPSWSRAAAAGSFRRAP